MLAWIQFTERFGSWSLLTFWIVVISVVLTLGFTVAVFIGGISDLRFLLRAIEQEKLDEASKKDDGRAEVVEEPAPSTDGR